MSAHVLLILLNEFGKEIKKSVNLYRDQTCSSMH